ncbi:MAG: hypothetical protein M9900_01465 [Flavobacteriales bacterium]|nr:hypothetical protein [Flavobacteriales bacterium]
MKPIEFTHAEVDLLKSLLTQRRMYYVDQAGSFVAANERYFRKETERLDSVANALSAGWNALGQNDKGLLQGCMNEFVMDGVKTELRVAAELSQPARYKHYRANREQFERLELVLGLWDKLAKKDEKFLLPSEFLAMMDQVFSAQVVYASFSELKPYKVAFFVNSQWVYRLSLESEREEIQGPYEYTKDELSQVFMQRLSPDAFCQVLRTYGKEHPLHAWHEVFLEQLDPAVVAAN